MNEILKEIESRIERIESDFKKSSVGKIISVADGVARGRGLRGARKRAEGGDVQRNDRL